MLVFDREKIELLIAQGRFSEAAAALAVSHAENRSTDDARMLAGVHALTGNERQLARLVEPNLFACRSAAEVIAHNDAAGGAGFPDDLIGGVELTWLGDSVGAYELLRRAADRSIGEQRFHFAIAAQERLAHHALLFGDLDVATSALDEAIATASDRALPDLLARCLVAAAGLALDKGDSTGATRLLERALAQKRSPDILALCAPIGVQIAAERGDDALLRGWITADVIDTALRGDEPAPAMAATLALLIAAATHDDLPAAIGLRRALLASESPTTAPELFSMGARYGDVVEARLASRRLAAAVAPRRRYLRAHYLLARAHLSFRAGKQAARIDYASDAARAFNAMGLRRWTNEAMLLMVRHEGAVARRGLQNRPSGSMLTEREQQVADLIRRGARNREVALALQISEHTVERHVSSILGRLGLRSRWQINDARTKHHD